ncbi:hypothetical protein BV22DRAFT_1196572 [Leucogyrophana mollusca]|uniref:Uncharacterized protein n=1 Tax=Leucogyrophana mollusca TaxID=85980 RepID=A0ACB8BCX0_9AGAM|nr:hypothetical protein BV22DRAFT_1196572 [Leucogyrophana mollusca]
MLGKILTMYTRSGGKNGKHAWTNSITNIMQASYLAVQAFENMVGSQFRAIPQDLAMLQAKQFCLIPPTSFLCALHSAPKANLENLVVSQTSSSESFTPKYRRS